MAILKHLILAATIIAAAILLRPVATEAQRTADLVRLVDNDALVNQVLKQLGSLQSAIVAQNGTARTTVLGSLNRPIGQVGDALKVYSAAPLDPCALPYKGDVAVSQTASTRLIQGVAGQRIYVCFVRLVAAAAEIPSFIEGTGTTCGTGTLAVSGSTTAANGESYAANGGNVSGNGAGTVMLTNKTGNDLCLQQSGSNRLAGVVVYAFGQ